MSWYLYILECGDDTLYTGITTNIERRLDQHRSGKGAKYTKGRNPLEVIYQEECANRSSASKREIEVKALSKAEKLMLVAKRP